MIARFIRHDPARSGTTRQMFVMMLVASTISGIVTRVILRKMGR